MNHRDAVTSSTGHLPEPTAGDGEQLFDVSSSGVTFADTHHRVSSS